MRVKQERLWIVLCDAAYDIVIQESAESNDL